MIYWRSAIFLLAILLFSTSCKSRVKTDLNQSNNKLYFKRGYHKQKHIYPINNIASDNASQQALKSVIFYEKHYNRQIEINLSNDRYIAFLLRNHNKTSRRTSFFSRDLETLPSRNVSFLFKIARNTQTFSNNDRALRILYPLFLNYQNFRITRMTYIDDSITSVVAPHIDYFSNTNYSGRARVNENFY
jgi:hypothetical protein